MSPPGVLRQQWFIPTEQPVKSLVWEGRRLVDWANGGQWWSLDGQTGPPVCSIEIDANRAAVSPSGEFVAVYEALGQRGLLLHQQTPLRELSRDEYHCTTYEYPLVFVTLPDGDEALIHCPENYCDLVVERALTGERLPAPSEGVDSFWSRLQVCPQGKWLGQAGWIWQPIDWAEVWLLDDVFKEPDILRRWHDPTILEDEMHSIRLLGQNLALVSHSNDEEEDYEESRYLSLIDLEKREPLSTVRAEEPLGTMFAVGNNHVLGLFQHPKLIEVSTGQLTWSWPEVSSGHQASSIMHHIDEVPSHAMHATESMFAIYNAAQQGIIVWQFDTQIL